MPPINTQAIGIVAMAVAIFSFQIKDNRKFFLAQGTSGLLFTVHFFLLGQYPGSLLNTVCILRGFGFGFVPKKFRTATMILLVLLNIGATVLTYDGAFAILALIANLAGTVAMWYDKDKVIRRTQVTLVSPGWLIYDIAAGSIGGMITEIFCFTSAIIYLFRIRNRSASPDGK